MTPDNVDLDDEAVWKDIRDDTTMIFQWESESAQAYLKRLMSDETIEIAKNHVEDFSYIKWFSFGNGLIRPGCASFRDSVANGEIVTTGFKELDDFLSITFGRIVMQEDIMKFLVNFCGYSDAESDNVRRLIAKKSGTESAIDEIHDRFLSYSHKKYNMPIDKLEEIFPPIKQGILDATGYAFSWNHSDAYSCIGYICGYLRYYYPLEFVTASLNIFEGKEDKTLAIIDYAKKKGFTISPIRFRKSRAKYGFDKKSNQILKGISSIKYMNATIADELYALKDNKYSSFIDLLRDIKEKTSVNSKQLNILIELDYFKEFGDINKLLSDVEIFDAFAERKQLRKAELDKMNVDYEVIRNIGCKETDKMFKDFDSIKLAKYISSNKVVRNRTLKEKIESQIEHLGYINISDEEYAGMCVVLSVDTKYSPRLKVHSLRYGNVIDCKVEKKLFNKNKLQYKDIIRISKSQRKPKTKKDENGDFVPIPNTSEIWLTKYNTLKM